MEIHAHIDAVRRAGERLAEAAGAAGLDSDVPTCPGWTVRDLLTHVSGVHRWAAFFVATGHASPTRAPANDAFAAAPAGPALLDWFKEGHSALVTALSEADPDLDCWSFLPAPSPLAFWARRQAHETTIHRLDAESAAGTMTPCDPDLAADGIDELLNGFFGRPGGEPAADPPVALAIRTTDTGAAWTVRIEPDGRVTTPGLADADCTVSGPADDLYRLLWNRGGTEELQIDGDDAVLKLWRDQARVIWGG